MPRALPPERLAVHLRLGLVIVQAGLLVAGYGLAQVADPLLIWAMIGTVLVLASTTYPVMFLNLGAQLARNRMLDATVGAWRLSGRGATVIRGRLVLDHPPDAERFAVDILVDLDELSGVAEVVAHGDAPDEEGGDGA